MGTKEKLIERFKKLPNDFTFDEMEKLLSIFGYVKSNKGKTSGSRVIFKNEHKHPIMLHRPHPGNIIKSYALKQVYNELKNLGYIKILKMNTLNYKGYIGSVYFSEKDNVFFGKVEGIEGLVNFEGDSVIQLKESFHTAVDDYLAYCKEEGIEPRKSYSGSLNVRLSPETHSIVATLSKQMGISINAFIKRAVENQIAIML